MLWLLASEDKDGWFDADPATIAFRLRVSEDEVQQAIMPLMEKGFLVSESYASQPLARPEHPASPEEQLKTQIQTETDARARFIEFFTSFPKQVDRERAWDSFVRASAIATHDAIMAGVGRYRTIVQRDQTPHRFIKAPHNWLDEKKWTEGQVEMLPPEEAAISKDKADRYFKRGKYAEAVQYD